MSLRSRGLGYLAVSSCTRSFESQYIATECLTPSLWRIRDVHIKESSRSSMAFSSAFKLDLATLCCLLDFQLNGNPLHRVYQPVVPYGSASLPMLASTKALMRSGSGACGFCGSGMSNGRFFAKFVTLCAIWMALLVGLFAYLPKCDAARARSGLESRARKRILPYASLNLLWSCFDTPSDRSSRSFSFRGRGVGGGGNSGGGDVSALA